MAEVLYLKEVLGVRWLPLKSVVSTKKFLVICRADGKDGLSSAANELLKRMLAAIEFPDQSTLRLLVENKNDFQKRIREFHLAFNRPTIQAAIILDREFGEILFGEQTNFGGLVLENAKPALVTYQLQDLLTQPALKKMCWAHLQALAKAL